MEIRGQRECKECGRQWSYYETGSVSCPHCGSVRSVGVGDRETHTAQPVTLDLSTHRAAVGESSIREAADGLKADLREYVRKNGYVRGGDLLPLDETSLAAYELLHAVDVVARAARPTEAEQLYVLELLQQADAGTRPEPSSVPDSLSDARGLAYAEAVDDYARDLSTWLDDHPDAEARTTLETLETHVKRAKALEGDLPLADSEALVTAADEVRTYLVDGDLDALAAARDRLSALV